MKKTTILLVLLALMLAVPFQAFADVTVYVGYADNLRPSPFFPTPWQGDAGVTFVGLCNPCDAGAVRIDNTGATSITIDSISVLVPTWFGNGSANSTTGIWTGSFPLVVGAGDTVILTQTGAFNFDTSDFGFGGLNSASNCDPSNAFAIANPAFCASIAPSVLLSINGVPLSALIDSGHVLDTGGFDFVNANPCPVVGDSPGNCNESLQWRLIGTTGITNPGGGAVPEPSSLVLLGTGLVGVGSKAWKRFIG